MSTSDQIGDIVKGYEIMAFHKIQGTMVPAMRSIHDKVHKKILSLGWNETPDTWYLNTYTRSDYKEPVAFGYIMEWNQEHFLGPISEWN